MKFDFYTVQIQWSGLGNDTVVNSIWRTKEEAEKQVKAEKFKERGFSVEIVGGFFGELDLVFND